jgi:hypothetical protein
VRRAAGGALDLEAAPEPDEIASRAHVLGGHARAIAWGERKGNIPSEPAVCDHIHQVIHPRRRMVLDHLMLR